MEKIFDPQPILFKELKLIFLNNLLELDFFSKFFLLINIYIIKSCFFQITSITFWFLPIILALIFGLILLFCVKPTESGQKNWILARRFVIFLMVYQFFLLLIYIKFFQLGFMLKVGSSGVFNLPYNFNLVKLLIPVFVYISIYITINFYIHYYKNIIDYIKSEFSAILLFLAFGSSMVFLQNDLFSIFLYFEIISFCIYGLLFLHK
jgi:NADH:ubiquinone oxidoreductase subunit 2 (subunit N)